MEAVVTELPSPYGPGITGELIPPGTRVGRFEIVECLAVTLIGALYRVYQRPEGGVRIIHLLPSELSRDPHLGARLEERVKRLTEIEVEPVLRVLELAQVEGRYAIVHADVPGLSLTAARRKDPNLFPLPPGEQVLLLKRLLVALDAAAHKGVRHLALTPDFVLRAESGQIHLWGLGVMEALDRHQFERFVSAAIVPIQASDEASAYTLLDALSPEWRNEEPVDVRSEFFGLGVLACHLATGHLPPAEWVSLGSIDERYGPRWDKICVRLLDPDPKERYQTLRSVGIDLDRIQAHGRKGGAGEKRSFPRFGLGRPAESGDASHPVRKVRLLRWSLILAAAVLGVAALRTYYPTIFGSAGGRSAPEIVRVEAGEAPNLVLRVTPAHARVRFLGEQDALFQVTDGRLELRGEPKIYLLSVEADRHESVELTLEVGRERIEETIELPLALAGLRVWAPAGSRLESVREDGGRVFVGDVPASGVLEIDERLVAQTYDFALSCEGYEPQFLRGVELNAGEWTELEARMQPYPAALRILSEPLGATVWLDDQILGATPLLIENLDVRTALRVRVGGGVWRSVEQELRLHPGRENLADFGTLERARGSLRVEVQTGGQPLPADAQAQLEITVDETVLAGRAGLSQELPPGSPMLRVAHPDYFAKEGEVIVRDGGEALVQVNLSPRPGRIQVQFPPGVSSGRAQVDGHLVRVDGAVLELPAGGDHEVVLQVTDFHPVERHFSLGANEVTTWAPDWQPLEGPREGRAWELPYLPLTMPCLAPGTVLMGSPQTESLRRPNEGPRSEVRLSRPFWIGATELSQDVYESIMGRNPSRFLAPDHPVESVSWNDAQSFCARLTERERRAGRLPEGYVYRLPTEAEWEYAARAGSDRPFVWGDSATVRDGNFRGQYPRDYGSAEIAPDEHYGTLPCGQFNANRWGLFDLHGNVREWTLDGYNDRLPGGLETDFHRQGPGRGYAVRGGSWEDFADRCRLAARETVLPSTTSSNLGFRLVLAPAL